MSEYDDAIKRLARAIGELAAAELNCLAVARRELQTAGAETLVSTPPETLTCRSCGMTRAWAIPSSCPAVIDYDDEGKPILCGSTVAC